MSSHADRLEEIACRMLDCRPARLGGLGYSSEFENVAKAYIGTAEAYSLESGCSDLMRLAKDMRESCGAETATRLMDALKLGVEAVTHPERVAEFVTVAEALLKAAGVLV